MDLEYHYSESTMKPEAVEINYSTVYLRKNFQVFERTIQGYGNRYFWKWEEATVSVSEFNKNANELLALGNANGGDDHLTIMETLTNLYDRMSVLEEKIGLTAILQYCLSDYNQNGSITDVITALGYTRGNGTGSIGGFKKI